MEDKKNLLVTSVSKNNLQTRHYCFCIEIFNEKYAVC
jgi:hypothetical protein